MDPKVLCRRHLLGEHLETHMFANGLAEGNMFQGFADSGLVELDYVDQRHDELVAEMSARGYNHRSPLVAHYQPRSGHVDVKNSLQVLRERCKDCADRQRLWSTIAS